MMAYIRLLLAFLVPPLAVFMQLGWGRDLALNVVLTLLGVVPGIVHAVYLLAARRPGLVKQEHFDDPTHRGRGLTQT